MPEQKLEMVDLVMDETLAVLENFSIAYLMRTENYRNVESSLNSGTTLSPDHMQRLLKVFSHDLNQDTKHAVTILKLLSGILEKIKLGEYSCPSELLSTAMAIVALLSKTAPLHKVQALQHLCLDVLLAFPDQVYSELAGDHHSDVLALVDQYTSSSSVENDTKVMILNVIAKVLSVLSEEDRKTFVIKGMSVWFSRIVPLIFTTAPPREIALNIIEIVIQDLTDVDYSDNPQWCALYKNISTTDKYLATLKTMLMNGDPMWHQAWCSVVKLLGTKLHKSANLINALLSVLESAFKMTMIERCRAFQCWKVLIENFALNMDQFFTNRRIKLLLIPLTVNNAKEEKSASSKFDTWWFLLGLLQPKIEQYMDSIVVPFLQFSFGPLQPKEGPTPVAPGLTFDNVKTLVVQSIVEIVGHTDCNGCVDPKFSRLPAAIMSPQNLMSHAPYWLHSIREATVLISEVARSESGGYVRCVYRSLLRNISAINDNSKQRVIYKDLLKMLMQLVLQSQHNSNLAELIFTTIGPCLINSNSGMLPLDDKYRCAGEVSLQYVFNLLLCPTFKDFYSDDNMAAVEHLKPLTDLGVNHSPDGFSKWLLQSLVLTQDFATCSLAWWTSLAKSVVDNGCQITEETAKDIFIWPITKLEFFSDVNVAVESWSELYTKMKVNLTKDSQLHPDIVSILMLHHQDTSSHNVFAAVILPLAVTSILENDPKKIDSLEKEYKLFCSLTEKIRNLPEDTDRTSTHAHAMVTCLSCVMNMLMEISKDEIFSSTVQAASNVVKILAASEQINENDKVKLILQLLDSTKEIVKTGNKAHFAKIKKMLYECLKLNILSINKKTQEILNNTKTDGQKSSSNVNKELDEIKTPPPKIKITPQKSKSTGKIVKKVMEGNEEFVVVKSNWKFNPRKLTEHQKEVLSKKREDIPALYQDLSQSQDEVKMKSWKVPDYKSDSQDISTSISNPLESSDSTATSNILKDLLNRDVCPNVIKEIITDNMETEKNKSVINESLNEKTNADVTSCKTSKATASKNGIKSPHISIKDRVNKNMQNLLGNVSPSGRSALMNKTLNADNENTPVSKNIQSTGTAMSEPPKIDSDRPSRTKRRPKKLEGDFEILGLIKKKRNSLDTENKRSDSSSSSSSSNEQKNVESHNLKNTERVSNLSPGPANSNNIDLAPMPVTGETIAHKENVSTEQSEEIFCLDLVAKKNNEGENELSQEEAEHQKLSQEHATFSEECKTPSTKESIETKPVTSKKKNRLEMQLAIDMVEGHPLLTSTEEPRSVRKSRLLNDSRSKRRKRENTIETKNLENTPTSKDKFEKQTKLENSTICVTPKINILQNINLHDESKKKEAGENCKRLNNETLICDNEQNKIEVLHSEDFIESSQESPVSTPTLSIKSSRFSNKHSKKDTMKSSNKPSESISSSNSECESDSGLTESKVSQTEQINNENENSKGNNGTSNDNCNSKDVQCMSDETIAAMSTQVVKSQYFVDSSENDKENNTGNINSKVTDSNNEVTSETNSLQKLSDETIAEMDTEPFISKIVEPKSICNEVIVLDDNSCETPAVQVINLDIDSEINVEPVISSSVEIDENESEIASVDFKQDHIYNAEVVSDIRSSENIEPCSPLKDSKECESDFLNNTYDISPIKTASPPLSPPNVEENSNDYVVITLESPDKHNEEQTGKCDSPEIFTNDKVSPDKRNESPPRPSTSITSGSPSSLSLKKNRSQMRTLGRGAQMLGLCQPGGFNSKPNNCADTENEEVSPVKSPVRRNLKMTNGQNGDCEMKTLEIANPVKNFLSLTKELPSATSSPSGPILKRKHCEISDETTQSPASKRKRVSFHDPPVSTTVSVHKYIVETIKSPQQSKNKDRRNRPMTSKKKLQMLGIEEPEITTSDSSASSISENEDNVTASSNTETDSLADTPVAVIVANDQLTNTQPIYPDLVLCTDPIVNIIGDLTTDSMKEMFLKELTDISTVGDLAKMTELEVNRLTIVSPKVETARKALLKYNEILKNKTAPKNVEVSHMEIQTEFEEDYFWTTFHERTSKEVIEACLEKDDFLEGLSSAVRQDVKQKMAEDLPADIVGELLCERLKSIPSEESETIVSKIIETQEDQFVDKTVAKVGVGRIVEKLGLENIQEYLLKNMNPGELVKFCVTLLQNKIPSD